LTRNSTRDPSGKCRFGAAPAAFHQQIAPELRQFISALPLPPYAAGGAGGSANRMNKFSTKLLWGNGRWIVMLYYDTKAIAVMSIEEWAALSATKHVLEYRPVKPRPRAVPKWLAKGRAAREPVP
jgi:hypothetical protein